MTAVTMQKSPVATTFNLIIIAAVVSWTAIIGLSFVSDYRMSLLDVERHARNTAYTSIDKDMLYRSWVAGQGGVYAPVSASLPPNPFLLHIPDRTLRTPSRKELTLVNPAYMTRQVFEMAQKRFGSIEHITSLRPLRPENSPDEWERRALAALEGGAKEVGEMVTINGEPHYRMMRPLVTEESCLKCHASQGYKAGDIRGGISLAVPLAPFLAVHKQGIRRQAYSHGMIWALGIAGIVLAGTTLGNRIREQSAVEAAVKRSEKQLKESQKVARLGSYAFDMAAGRWESTEMLDEIFGITDSAYLKDVQGWLNIVHPDDREEMNKCLGEHVPAGGNVFDREYRIVRLSDRTERWVHCRGEVLTDSAGTVVQMFGTIQDITERKRAEQMLLLMQTAIDNISDEAFWATAGGEFVYVNGAACRSLGYTETELLRMSVADIDPDLAEERWPAFWEELKVRKQLVFETCHRSREGMIYPVEVTANFVEFMGNEYTCVFARDITQRTVAEESRQRLEQQLLHAQKMESVGQLAGGIAHDFNNILTAIIGFATLIQARIGDRDKALMYVDEIFKSSGRAADLTRSLLAFGRKQIIDPRPSDLNDIVAGMQEMVGRLIGEDIELRIVPSSLPMSLRADRNQIEQVIMNLCTNARDAMQQGGTLVMETYAVEADEVFARSHILGAAGRYVVLAVSDTGVGMDDRIRDRIFEPFFTTKEIGRGSGLGLSIVYGIVKQHGGSISVTSRQGTGTTFKIYLPWHSGAHAEQMRPAEKGEIQAGSGVILVAEDEEGVRKSMRLLLEEHGYQIMEACDGEEAVRVFAENRERVQLVLLDVIMPRKNGGDALREIKAMSPGVKSILLSGYAADIIGKKGVLEEGLDFLPKPVHAAVLLGRIRELLH